MNKAFYFRKSSTLTDDDDNSNSLIIPVNRVYHMAGASGALVMYYRDLNGCGY